MKTVQERLETILREQLGLNNDDEILPKSPITELGADSLDAVEVVMAIEEDFDIAVLKTVADLMKDFGSGKHNRDLKRVLAIFDDIVKQAQLERGKE